MKINKVSNGYRIVLDSSPPVSGHRPSVDAMYYSLGELRSKDIIAVIMTGMGADGADGLIGIKDNNGYIIAQDEESCVVFGMPKSAIKKNDVDKVVNLDSITKEIIKAMEV